MRNEKVIRKQYYNQNFQKKLNEAKKFEEELLDYLKKIFDEKKYIIENNFDINKGNINLFELKGKLKNWQMYHNYLYKCLYYLSPKSSKKEDIENKLKNLHGHDIVIRNKKTGKIEYLIEAKDFGQMLYINETGLPRYYLYKLNNIKKIFEELQGSQIKQFLLFKDNEEIDNKRKKIAENNSRIKQLMQENKLITVKKNGKYVPYGIELTDEILRNTKTRKNYKGEVIPSYFIVKSPKNADLYHPQALEQLLWKIEDMKIIDKLFSGYIPRPDGSSKIARKVFLN